jgi:RNA-binding motif X-linked protein 2
MTNIKNVIKYNTLELERGITGTNSSWHAQYKDSAWVFIGGLQYDLTEGDVVCVFSQYGEVVNINLVRDKKTGKSKGFCFLCYENQKSTVLAVDNLNGIKVTGRTIRVDHVEEYKVPKDHGNEDELTMKIRDEGIHPITLKTPEDEFSEEESPKKKKKKKDKKKKKKKDDRSKEDSDDCKRESKDSFLDVKPDISELRSSHRSHTHGNDDDVKIKREPMLDSSSHRSSSPFDSHPDHKRNHSPRDRSPGGRAPRDRSRDRPNRSRSRELAPPPHYRKNQKESLHHRKNPIDDSQRHERQRRSRSRSYSPRRK